MSIPRVRLALLTLGAGLSLSLALAHEPRDGRAEVPFNPFSAVHTGDWVAYRTLIRPVQGQALTLAWVWRIEGVSDVGSVAVLTERHFADGASQRRPHEGAPFSRCAAPRFEQLFATPIQRLGPDQATELTVAGRTFPATRVEFDAAAGTETWSWTVWLSPEVPGAGFLATRVVQRTPAGEVTNTVEVELAGLGSGDQVCWGVRPGEIDLSPPR